MKLFTRLLALFLAPAILINCSARTLPLNPSTNKHIAMSARQSVAADVFANGIPDIFAAARNKDLTDAEIDAFIDKAITGTDRTLARKFMKMMPKNMRGDFVYVDSNDRLVTNNPRLLPYVHVIHTSPVPLQHSARVSSHRIHTLGGYQSYCAPDNPPGSPKGPYVRQVSQCGFTTGWTFLSLQCGTTTLEYGHAGYMYMELRGNGGSLSEGGLFVPKDGPTGPNQGEHSINPYVSVPNNGQTMVNAGARYDCQYELGIVSGATQDGKYIYTATGELPSTCVPQVAFCSGNAFQFVNQAWEFANAPGDITGRGSDSVGVITPCVQCSISRVTSIAQGNISTYVMDGDLFQSDPLGNAYLHYMQTAFGEWESDCTPGTSLCTFDYSLVPTKYYGGYQYYPSENNARSIINPTLGAQYGPWESWDGINMNTRTTALAAYGAFTTAPPPYSWRQRGYTNPGVDRVTNWEINTGGSTWDTYCTAQHLDDNPPYGDLGGENCDGNQNTDHPSMPYPGGVAI